MKTITVVATILLLSAACATTNTTATGEATRTAAVAPNAARAEAARQALVEWFECEECEEGQLAAVVKYGAVMIPNLRGALLEGLSPASEELLRRDLARRYDELRRYAETHPNAKPAGTREEFVELYVANYHAQYRVRAAQALGALGGEEAAKALEEGGRRAERPDVRREIEAALKRVKTNR